MAKYEKVFDNPYPNGWEDLPSENTPITAQALQEHTDAIEHLEQYLEDNPIEKGGSDVEWKQIVKSGTKIATITIDEEETDVYAPEGGGVDFEVGNELALEDDKLRYKANYGTSAEFEAFKQRTDIPDGATYHVTDDYIEGGGSGQEIYDGEERVIGTWFGKTLYRKSINFTSPSSRTGNVTITHNSNVKEYVNVYGSIHYENTNNAYPIPSIRTEYNIYHVLHPNSIDIVYQTVTDPGLYNQNGHITIKYTKVGD